MYSIDRGVFLYTTNLMLKAVDQSFYSLEAFGALMMGKHA